METLQMDRRDGSKSLTRQVARCDGWLLTALPCAANVVNSAVPPIPILDAYVTSLSNNAKKIP